MKEKLGKVKIHNCAISEITLAELVFGAENSINPQRNLSIVEEFVSQLTVLPIYTSIYLYGKEKARLRKSGIMISDFDLLIGCTSIERNLIMVTENLKEFERIEGIKIESWVDRSI
ncbi:MAG: PIN domain-containing protein [Leadbetterella sp.]|nr:PIN domain-containing protein [Leadbetterella sp.]